MSSCNISEPSSPVFLILKCLLLQIQLKLYFKRSISVTALITKYQHKYQCYSIKKKVNYPEWNAVFPFGFQLNSRSLNSCFSSERGCICKIQTCQEAKLNEMRFGFSRGAYAKGTINNASQNLKPVGWVWEVGKSLREQEGLQHYLNHLSPETQDLQVTHISQERSTKLTGPKYWPNGSSHTSRPSHTDPLPGQAVSLSYGTPNSHSRKISPHIISFNYIYSKYLPLSW